MIVVKAITTASVHVELVVVLEARVMRDSLRLLADGLNPLPSVHSTLFKSLKIDSPEVVQLPYFEINTSKDVKEAFVLLNACGKV